jgi:hypothetical protein
MIEALKSRVSRKYMMSDWHEFCKLVTDKNKN